MSSIDTSNRFAPNWSRGLSDSVTARAPSHATQLDERGGLQARADAGHSLTPVEHGQLARLGRETAPRKVGDFKLTNAKARDKADFKAALDYLQQKGPDGKYLSPTAVDLLAKLPKGTKIHITHDGDDSYDPNTKTINWDPRSALQVSSGAGKQSAALGLIHEIDHAVNGQRHPTPTGDGYENTEEKRVITGAETRIAHDLGEPTRTDHGGTATSNEASTTAHTKVDYSKTAPAEGIAEKTVAAAKDLLEHVRELLKHIF